MSGVERLGELPLFAPRCTRKSEVTRPTIARSCCAAARRLVAEHGTDAVTMDDIAAAAGVGKGTLFRRFGSRAALMMVLLDEDERANQQAFLFGPPPLGPDAPPIDRLVTFGQAADLFRAYPSRALSEANRDPQGRYNAPAMVQRTHVRVLLQAAHTSRRSRRPDGCPARAARCRLRRASAQRTRPHPANVGRCVGESGTQAVRPVTELDPACRPRPVSGVSRAASPSQASRTAGHRRRQRRSHRTAEGRHLRLV